MWFDVKCIGRYFLFWHKSVQLQLLVYVQQQLIKYTHFVTQSLEGTFQSSGQQTPAGVCNWLN